MIGFELPHAEPPAVPAESAYISSMSTGVAHTPPGGLIDISSNRRLTVLEGRVVDAECPVSPDTARGSYYTWRPIVPPCPYFD